MRPSILAISLFAITLALPTAAQPPPKAGVPLPGAKSGGSDDGIKPSPKTVLAPGTKAPLLMDQDSLFKPNLGAINQARRAAFATRETSVKAANERLAPQISSALDKSGFDRAAFQKQVESCVRERNLQARAACAKNLRGTATQKLTPVLKKAVTDLPAEQLRLGKDFGIAKPVPRPNDPPAEPELVFESTATMLSAEVVPFNEPRQAPPNPQVKTAPFVVLDFEGDDLTINTDGSMDAHCGAVVAGACYKRVGLGGRFTLGAGRRTARARINGTVQASALAAVVGGYGSAEAKVSVVVRRFGSGEVCRAERSLATAVAPVLGVANSVLLPTEVGFDCTFEHDGSGNRYDVAATVEVWAGNGGLGGASAFVGMKLTGVTLTAAATTP